MKLKGRLKSIGERIPECSILVDVGTDHAYIPIYAVKARLCEKALAADVRTGPLEIAQSNIKRSGVESYIEIRLGNGLEPVEVSECDVIVIAGMGGQLVRDILSASFEKAQKANLLLLQPNNAGYALRKWLYESGFDIVEEALALDAGKLYCIISAKWIDIPVKKDHFLYYIGDKLINSKDPLLHKYLTKRLKELEVILTGRSRANKRLYREASGAEDLDTADYRNIYDRLMEYVKEKKI